MEAIKCFIRDAVYTPWLSTKKNEHQPGYLEIFISRFFFKSE